MWIEDHYCDNCGALLHSGFEICPKCGFTEKEPEEENKEINQDYWGKFK